MEYSELDFESWSSPSLTDDQVQLLALFYVISSSLSIFGSLIIVHRVVRNRELSRSYDRIMLGMSFCDIVASLGYMSRPFLLPKESSTRITAIGSDVTCTFLGWVTQFGFASIVYNAILSFYMLAFVRFSMKPTDFAARYEAYLHALTLFYFLATATMAVPFGIYGELALGMGCWIVEVPECQLTGKFCLRTLLGWLFVGIPLFITFAVLLINNIVIVVYVMKSLRIEGQGRTRMQRIQVRRVATQGFLYVAAFVSTYFPGLAIRLRGSAGMGLSDEASIFKMLLLQSILIPLQGFLNMLIYIRPTYLRFRRAGTSRLKSMQYTLFARDIPRILSEIQSTNPQSSRPPQSKESFPDEQHENEDGQQIPKNSGGTEDNSGEDFADEEDNSFDESDQIVVKTPSDPNLLPAKSILKGHSARVGMDGYISSD